VEDKPSSQPHQLAEVQVEVEQDAESVGYDLAAGALGDDEIFASGDEIINVARVAYDAGHGLLDLLEVCVLLFDTSDDERHALLGVVSKQAAGKDLAVADFLLFQFVEHRLGEVSRLFDAVEQVIEYFILFLEKLINAFFLAKHGPGLVEGVEIFWTAARLIKHGTHLR